MGVIVPAILPTSRKDLEGKLALLEGVVDAVQIDIVDGLFASPATWPYLNSNAQLKERFEDGTMLPYLGHFTFEIDLMAMHPEESAGLWIAAGAQRVVLHAESSDNLSAAIDELSVRYGHAKGFAADLISLGLSIGNDTDLSLLAPYMQHADFIQCMGIKEIGKQGQPFDSRVLERIRAIRRDYPQMTIQVDGAVSLATAPRLLDAGVDRLVVGSALWKAPNLKDTLHAFRSLMAEHQAQ